MFLELYKINFVLQYVTGPTTYLVVLEIVVEIDEHRFSNGKAVKTLNLPN
jgi:hypothetical protein